nr:MAG TPA: hypothetical protein [Caudoviricetes sp.]
MKLILYTKLCAIKGHKEEAFSDLPRFFYPGETKLEC